MLLQAKKEFAICGDLRPDDVFFYYTTTSVPFICKLSSDILTESPDQRVDDVEFPREQSHHRMHSSVV